MSAKKRKETLEKKQKANKSKKANEIENLQEEIETDITEESSEMLEVAEESSAEELLEKERSRAQNMEDRYLRVNAEFENYKKRMIRESSDRFKFFNLDLIKELLPSLDNLERAISHAKNDNTDVESMIVGLEMVNKMTHEVFEKFGVSRINAVGEVFDPNVHQAVGVVESDAVPDNQVVEECLGGYILHGRIIRPAMVRVSGKN
ncbi:MAG: nucleotide exchange factor GrpE [SAR324 cluster bacterium]|jgi:molecular chaperone GrpE|nr:nucleotide exchange factor GrpE [SAR324 cluster bacterium]MCH2265318.1 nucleotide exchange factor GrpE [SAR324 cluster bacterium]